MTIPNLNLVHRANTMGRRLPPSASAIRLRQGSRALWRCVVALVFGLLAAPLGADDKPLNLRVMSYNIHYGQGNDGKYDLERLARVITRSKADLVGLQEVDVGVTRSGRVHQARRLAELTGMAVRYGPTQHYQGGLYGNAVLTRWPILDVAIHPLPYSEATAQRVTYPRGAIAVTIRGPDGRPLRFVSTHFQHNVPADRVAEAKAINTLFASDADQLPTILAGDMNAQPASQPMQVLLERWSQAADEPVEPTAPSEQPRSRIDYIMFRPAEHFRLLHAEVIDEPMASDHRPVFAILQLPPR